MTTNVALESGKDMLVKKIQLQNALGNKAVDTSSTLISIFGYQVRDSIQHKAELCNMNSSQLSALDPKNGRDMINELCSNTSQQVNDLHETLLWGIDAGKDILDTDGLSAAGQVAAQSAIEETASFGQAAVNQAANNLKSAVAEINKAASNIETKQGEAPTAKEEIKQEIKSSVSKVENELPKAAEVADKVNKIETKTSTNTESTEKKATTKATTTKAVETAKTDKPETTETITEPTETTTKTVSETVKDIEEFDTIDTTEGLSTETLENNIFAVDADTEIDIPNSDIPAAEPASTPVPTEV